VGSGRQGLPAAVPGPEAGSRYDREQLRPMEFSCAAGSDVKAVGGPWGTGLACVTNLNKNRVIR
jgi:hypothetical protein